MEFLIRLSLYAFMDFSAIQKLFKKCNFTVNNLQKALTPKKNGCIIKVGVLWAQS